MKSCSVGMISIGLEILLVVHICFVVQLLFGQASTLGGIKPYFRSILYSVLDVGYALTLPSECSLASNAIRNGAKYVMNDILRWYAFLKLTTGSY